MTPLSREGIKQGIEKLEHDIGLNLKNAVVCSAEFGVSIITKGKPFEYLNLFGYTKKLTRNECSKWTGVESVTYTSKTGSFGFIGYDKTKEMLDKKQKIPPLFDGANVLRLEYKIRKRRGIKAKFKKDITAYSLFDVDIYQRFQELFFDMYRSIEKMGRLVYVDRSKEITPAKFRKLQAEQYRQSNFKDSHYSIQQINEAGKISPKNLERIRAEENDMGNDIYISDQSALIKELDVLVYDRVMFGA